MSDPVARLADLQCRLHGTRQNPPTAAADNGDDEG